MKKSDLKNALKEGIGLTQNEAKAAMCILFDTIKKGILVDGKISIVGFGTFELRSRKARNGINPSTKEKMRIPEKKTVVFHPFRALKEYINAKE